MQTNTNGDPSQNTSTPRQYSQPIDKSAFRSTSDHTDRSMDDNDGEDTSGIDSDYDHKEEEFEDKMDNFVRAYHTFRGAKKLFTNKHILNTVTVHAHLEYEDHFAGTTHGINNHYIICNNGANTWVIGEGWNIIDRDPIRQANLIAFDPDKLCKLGCPIITASTTVRDQNGHLTRIVVRDAVYNQGSPISLCSEFQT